jgi:hypothetical protein
MPKKKSTSGQDGEDSVQQRKDDKANCEAPYGGIVGFAVHDWSPLLKDNYTLHAKPSRVKFH